MSISAVFALLNTRAISIPATAAPATTAAAPNADMAPVDFPIPPADAPSFDASDAADPAPFPPASRASADVADEMPFAKLIAPETPFSRPPPTRDPTPAAAVPLMMRDCISGDRRPNASTTFTAAPATWVNPLMIPAIPASRPELFWVTDCSRSVRDCVASRSGPVPEPPSLMDRFSHAPPKSFRSPLRLSLRFAAWSTAEP